MMAKAVAKYVRVSPRKVRMVINLIRGRSVPQALNILFNMNKGARHPVEKVLKSAVSNAEVKMPGMKKEEFYISKIIADGGPMLKRYRAAAMGRATMIRKRTTHICVELDVKHRAEDRKQRTPKDKPTGQAESRKQVVYGKK